MLQSSIVGIARITCPHMMHLPKQFGCGNAPAIGASAPQIDTGKTASNFGTNNFNLKPK